MKVLMVTNTFEPARNGVALWASLSTRELRAAGHAVEVLTYAHPLRRPDETPVHDVPAYFGVDPDFPVAPVMGALPRAVTGRDWDVVHMHHPILLARRGVGVARRCGAKTVFTCHSVYTDYLDEYFWGAGRLIKPALTASVARFINSCDLALAPSTSVVRWMRGIGVTARIERLDAPADTARLPRTGREEAKAALGVGGRPILLYAGRIADEKRVEELLEEFATTVRAVPTVLLALAGAGPKSGDVERRAARLGITESVRMLGSLPGDALARWYSASDACVSASRSETGPTIVVEAMACGTPTIAVRGPGFEDRIVDGANGLLVDGGTGALSAAMTRVVMDRGLRAHLADGALASAPRYTPCVNTSRLLEMYGELIA